MHCKVDCDGHCPECGVGKLHESNLTMKNNSIMVRASDVRAIASSSGSPEPVMTGGDSKSIAEPHPSDEVLSGFQDGNLNIYADMELVRLVMAMKDQKSALDCRNLNGASNIVSVSACRSCSAEFTYALSDGLVHILCGIPPPGLVYKAVSHVWGPPSKVILRCTGCNTSTSIHLRSRQTFHHIMELAGVGSTVWFDNLSINQQDPVDVSLQVARMGEIYGNASVVCVLLPPSDVKAFLLLHDLHQTAKLLIQSKSCFQNPIIIQYQQGGNFGDTDAHTSMLAQLFFAYAQNLEEILPESLYWQRAWTFQEWSLARDVDVWIDDTEFRFSDESIILASKVKSVILYASLMMADYKLRYHSLAWVDLGFPRGLIMEKLDSIKRIFPYEGLFKFDDERDHRLLLAQMQDTYAGTTEILGLRQINQPRTSNASKKARLELMLDAFGAFGTRQAKYEADLVCGWASMCNIEYGYSKLDSLDSSIAKVVREIRALGIRVFNFIPGAYEQQDIGRCFFDFSKQHLSINATSNSSFPGLPILTGRSDTGIYFSRCLRYAATSGQSPNVPLISLNQLPKSELISKISLNDRAKALESLYSACSGLADGIIFNNIIDCLRKELDSVGDGPLQEICIIVIAVKIELGAIQSVTSSSKKLNLWALAPPSMEASEMFVARESINGTLVLAHQDNNKADRASLVAYLTLTDQQCGTYLVPSDINGEIELDLKSTHRLDIRTAEAKYSRRFQGRVSLSSSGTYQCGLQSSNQALGKSTAAGDEPRAEGYTAGGNDNVIKSLDVREYESKVDFLKGLQNNSIKHNNDAVVQSIGQDKFLSWLSPIDITHLEGSPDELRFVISEEKQDAMRERLLNKSNNHLAKIDYYFDNTGHTFARYAKTVHQHFVA